MNDLDFVAELRAGIPEPPSTRLAVGRTRLTAAIAAESRPGTTRSPDKRPNRVAIASCAGVAAAVTAAAALVLTSGRTAVPTAGRAQTIVTAAWTVRRDTSGTVTIYLRQYADPAGLQQTLHADGVNAIVRRVPVAMELVGLAGRLPGSGKTQLRILRTACRYATIDNAPAAVQRAVVSLAGGDLPAVFTIHPGAMPRMSALLVPFLTGLPASQPNGQKHIKPQLPVVLNNDRVPACVPFSKPAPSPGAPAPK